MQPYPVPSGTMTTQTPADIRAIPDLRERYAAAQAPEARQAYLDAIAELAKIPREIVAELREQGMNHTQIGEVLGISRQRAQQLDTVWAGRPVGQARARRTAAKRKPAAE